MTITSIEISNVKGFEHKEFKLQLLPNKPNLLIAPNGFGKSSIATAFAAMTPRKMILGDKDYHREDPSLQPELSITLGDQKLTANGNKNEIRKQFDVTVIRNGLVPKAKRTFKGGVSSHLEIQPITIRKIHIKADFGYQPLKARAAFGENGKILPNISDSLKNTALCEAVSACDLSKVTGKLIQRSITSVIDKVNQQKGTAEQILKWIKENLLDDFRAIAPINDLAESLQRLSLASSDAEAFLAAYQIADLYGADRKLFDVALGWLQYIAEKNYYAELLQSLCSSSWHWAELNEDKKKETLSVVFPQAHQISNGQRDVVTLFVQMHKALYEGSRKPLILVIDEVFDYLDDANLVAFQYYITTLIKEYKQRGRTIYPIILTHLDPGVFFDFCFNKHKIQTHHLLAQSNGKSRDMLKLIEIREHKDTSEHIKDDLAKHWFHYHPDAKEIGLDEWPNGLHADWRKSDDFHAYTATELNRYFEDKNYDSLAVCVAVRIAIEENAYELLGDGDERNGFLATYRTKEKLNYAAQRIVDIPEVYFLLGLIHNTNLHWKQGRDYVSPLSAKLSHPTIKSLILQATEATTNQ